MRHRILLPTDFSKNSWHAINYALKLFKHDYCDFYLLNVFSTSSNIIDSFVDMEPGSVFYETAKFQSEAELAKVLDMIALKNSNNSKHHFESISTFNNVVEAIKCIVEEKDIEMIIMGTKGKTDSRKVIYGSTALNIMEKVRNCPVIVVPEKALKKLPKEIVFPTSYKIPIKKRELNHLLGIAKKCGASIEILHISEEDALDKRQVSNKNLLVEYLEGINHCFHTLSQMELSSAINCFIESRGSDMVAFINTKHIFFSSLFTQPLVKELAYNSRVPILVMHDLKN
jgi:nucleotide-binding universal stress UspA family protein